MEGGNPYAPPRAALAHDDATADEPELNLPPWSLEGDLLSVRNGASLPDVCLFTGEPTTREDRLDLQLSWTPGWFRFAAVVVTLMAAFAYSAVRRTATVDLALSAAGRKQRRAHLALFAGAVADGLALFVIAAGRGGALELLAGVLLFCLLAVLIGLALDARVFRVVRIDRRYAHLRLRPPVAEAFARLPAPPATPG